MINPKQDWMVIRKIDRKSSIIVPEGGKVAEMVPFMILSIGPGRYMHGTFVKTSHYPGSIVFINGPVTETKFEDISYSFAREEYIVAELIKEKIC